MVAVQPEGISRSLAASAYPSGAWRETLAHSISPARSRSPARSTLMRMPWATWVSRRTLFSTSVGIGPPTACGQKYCSWRSAAEWNVRAWTPSTPRSRRRVRISAAARAVNVSARVRWGSNTPEATP